MKITICGSIAFYVKIESIRDELVALGHEVRIPQLALEAPAEFGGEKKINFAKYIEEHGGIEAFPVGHHI